MSRNLTLFDEQPGQDFLQKVQMASPSLAISHHTLSYWHWPPVFTIKKIAKIPPQKSSECQWSITHLNMIKYNAILLRSTQK